ncbi:hypothetical protein DPMN_078821 [Dreissena polymorpha]|uniref:Uncharacterized protein n=1 Tax=Dreissena polymorpha TaxID=45954 RepID=A0A9D4BPH6_DREPO|nr:hypothetical protein DPMN_078821 [Dreissena polymorpha]
MQILANSTRNGSAEAHAYPNTACLTQGRSRVGNRGPCIVEINRIVIRKVQYQLEVNRCRNEEIIVKGNVECVWPMWVECPRGGGGVMGPCIVEIDSIVIIDVQYQFEVNRSRNKEVNVKNIQK